MKKCPFCNAQIEENARFCLFCMTPLEEKQLIATPKENNKWWLYTLPVWVALLIACSVFIFVEKDNFSDNVSSTYSFSLGDNSSVQSSSKNENNTVSDNTSVGSSIDSSSETLTSSNSTTTGTSSNASANEVVSSDDSDSSSEISTTPTTTTISYSYRDAQYGDDFSVGGNLENCIVITGVETVSSNGEYAIPEAIDGKKVVAIMGLAFCDDNVKDTVKKVIVPSTVKTIWNYAFANCYNLTDIYFCGNAIYTESKAFAEESKRNGTLTIHCSANCSDRNYRYYKNSASYYGANYEEWNG